VTYIAGLKCRMCFYAEDITKCGATTQCPDGEVSLFYMNMCSMMLVARQSLPPTVMNTTKQISTVIHSRF